MYKLCISSYKLIHFQSLAKSSRKFQTKKAKTLTGICAAAVISNIESIYTLIASFSKRAWQNSA